MRAGVKEHAQLPSPYMCWAYPLYWVAIVSEKNKKYAMILAADNWQKRKKEKKKLFPHMSLHAILFLGQKQLGQKVPVIVKNL